MKALMFGWEFPPHILGGLGTASYGLTRGMAEQPDMDITFVIPKPWGDEDQSFLRIIGANSVVGCDVAPYSIVIGNPAKELRKRFDAELIDLMLRFRWWDKSIEEINRLIPLLTCSDLAKVKEEIEARL